jgi:hypothetical protein
MAAIAATHRAPPTLRFRLFITTRQFPYGARFRRFTVKG